MATSVIPALIDALVAAAKAALPPQGIVTLDGFGVTEFVGNYLMIGVDDPYRPDASTSATSQQSWAHANYTTRDEEGHITCAALSYSGDAVAKTARDSAYATTVAVENLLRANPTLGLPTLLWTSYGTNTSLEQSQDEDGSWALIVFDVYFRARI
jgi:hypothetical protein